MKKIIGIVLILMLTSIFSYANLKKIIIVVDGVKYDFKENCEIYRGSTYASTDFLEKVFKLNKKIDEKNITLTKDNIEIKGLINSGIYTSNEYKIYAKEVIYKKDNKVFLPLRLVSNLLNYDVLYKENTNKVIFVDKSKINIREKFKLQISKNDYLEKSSDNKWGVWIEQHYEANNVNPIYTVYLKNIETGEIKDIYSSERVITYRLYWTKDNELIMGSYKDRENKKDRPHIVIYNPITQKVRHLMELKKEADMFYSNSKNALVYKDFAVEIHNKFKIFYIDTKK